MRFIDTRNGNAEIREGDLADVLDERIDSETFQKYLDDFEPVQIFGTPYDVGRVLRLVDPDRFEEARGEHVEQVRQGIIDGEAWYGIDTEEE